MFDSDYWKQLTNVLIKLYQQGPDEGDIWKNSGGDSSIFRNSQSRKEQWQHAIEKLRNGGGGKHITLESLLNNVKEDFHSDPDFIKLYETFQLIQHSSLQAANSDITISLGDNDLDILEIEINEIRERLRRKSSFNLSFIIPEYTKLKAELKLLDSASSYEEKKRRLELRNEVADYLIWETDLEIIYYDALTTIINDFSIKQKLISNDRILSVIFLELYKIISFNGAKNLAKLTKFDILKPDNRYSFSIYLSTEQIKEITDKEGVHSASLLSRIWGLNLSDFENEVLHSLVYPKMVYEYLRLKYQVKKEVDVKDYFNYNSWIVGLG